MWNFYKKGSQLQILYMRDINMAVNERCRAGVRRMVKHNLRVDMTPMVDLGFLLITFFVITTELAKPTAMDLYMPKDGPDMPLGESGALTVLVDNNKLYSYNGKWEDAIKNNSIMQTSFSGTADLRKIIEDKQKLLDVTAAKKEGRDGLMLVIKPGQDAFYKNVVDVLDEITISRVKKYAIVKQSDEERKWLQGKQ